MKLWVAILLLSLSVAVFIALYLLMGFGLRKMAIATKNKNAWLAFVPFARYFLAGKVVGQVKMFGKKMKNAGFWLMLVYAAYFALNTAALVLNYLPLVLAYVYDAQIFLTPNEYGQLVVDFSGNFSYEYSQGVYTFLDVEYFLGMILNIVYLFFFFYLFMLLFRKFNPRSHFMFSILSFIGELFGLSVASVIVFTQRNKKPVNYNDYVKEQYMRMQGMYAPPRENPPDNPFREFGGRGENDPGDPFSEFGGKKDAPSGGPTEGVSPDGENKDGKSGKNDKNDKNDGGDSPFDGF
mgnify:FL=1